jgi:putative glutamine amidotransferase
MQSRASPNLPLIGVVAGSSDAPELTVCRNVLLDALTRAGAYAIILPHARPETARAYLDACDGLLLPGGGDFSPSFFGGSDDDPRLGRLDPRRDEFEFSLAHEADRRGMPLLGICKGMQWMAVIRGGTLHIDLQSDCPGAQDHQCRTPPASAAVHEVLLEAGSHVERLAGVSRLAVNSRHHQAVAEPGHRVKAAAVALDGVIEAIEWADRPFAIGVQWHPEDQAVAGDTFSLRLFSDFVEQASAYGRADSHRGARSRERTLG